MEKYKILEKVSEGRYGKVYKAVDKETGKLVAIKQFRETTKDIHIIPTATLREMSLLHQLSSSNYIVKLEDVEQLEKHERVCFFFIFELLDCDLHKYIKEENENPKPEYPMVTKMFMYQLCKGLAHCHSHNVLHRDLKPKNLLIDKEKLVLKIADLGLARKLVEQNQCYTAGVGTILYQAPEVLLKSSNYGKGVDIWSVGCIFAEMARKKPLFSGELEIRQLLQIFRLLGAPTEEQCPELTSLMQWPEYPKWEPQNLADAVPLLDPNGVDLLSKMLVCNSANRISAEDAMNHPYFDDLDKENL